MTNTNKILFAGIALFALIFLSSALIAADDYTPPAVGIYMSQDNVAGEHNSISYSTTVYAHLYNIESQSDIDVCQIDWGEGAGWENVNKGTEDTWYMVSHTYSSMGLKTISYQCNNSDGYMSNNNSKHALWDTIDIQLTPPSTGIYLGEEADEHNAYMWNLTVYANLWNNDSVAIDICQINWNDGASVWENIATGTPDTWYSVSHNYTTYGDKNVSYRCNNTNGAMSLTNTKHRGWDSVELRDPNANLPPTVYIDNPANGATYNDTNQVIMVRSDQQIVTWQYALNGGANATFTPNVTSITANPGSNVLIVYGTNSNGTGMAMSVFTINNSGNNNSNSTVPVITIVNPANGGTFNTTNLALDVTSTQPIVIWQYALNGGANQTFTPNSTITAQNGTNVLIVYGTNANGTGLAISVFTVNTGGSNNSNSTAPVVNIVNPQNGAVYNITENLALDVTANQPIVTWRYSLNGGSNQTFTPNSTINTQNGTNVLVVYGTNMNGTGMDMAIFRSYSGGANGSNSTAPVINVTSPRNGLTYNTSTILLNATADQPVFFWMYSLNGGNNQTFTPGVTTITAQSGTNTVIVYGISTNGIGVATSTFVYNASTVDPGDDEDDDTDDNDSGTIVLRAGTSGNSGSGATNATGVIDLSPAKKASLSLAGWLWILLIAIIILFIAVVTVGIIKFGLLN